MSQRNNRRAGTSTGSSPPTGNEEAQSAQQQRGATEASSSMEGKSPAGVLKGANGGRVTPKGAKRVSLHVDANQNIEAFPSSSSPARSRSSSAPALPVPTTPQELVATALHILDKTWTQEALSHALLLVTHALGMLPAPPALPVSVSPALAAPNEAEEKMRWSEYGVFATQICLSLWNTGEAVQHAEGALQRHESPLTLSNAAWAALRHTFRCSDPSARQNSFDRVSQWFADALHMLAPKDGDDQQQAATSSTVSETLCRLRLTTTRRAALFWLLINNKTKAQKLISENLGGQGGEGVGTASQQVPQDPVLRILLSLIWGSNGFTERAIALVAKVQEDLSLSSPRGEAEAGSAEASTLNAQDRVFVSALACVVSLSLLVGCRQDRNEPPLWCFCASFGSSAVPEQEQAAESSRRQPSTSPLLAGVHREILHVIGELNTLLANNANHFAPYATHGGVSPVSAAAQSQGTLPNHLHGLLLGSAGHRLVQEVGGIYTLLLRAVVDYCHVLGWETARVVQSSVAAFVASYPHLLMRETLEELTVEGHLCTALGVLHELITMGREGGDDPSPSPFSTDGERHPNQRRKSIDGRQPKRGAGARWHSERFSRAIVELEAALAVDPRNSRALEIMGIVMLRCARTLRQWPGPPSPSNSAPPPTVPGSQLRRLFSREGLNRSPLVEEVANTDMEQRETGYYGGAVGNGRDAEEAERDYEERLVLAVSYFTHALHLNPTSVHATKGLATAFQLLGDEESALQYALAAFELELVASWAIPLQSLMEFC